MQFDKMEVDYYTGDVNLEHGGYYVNFEDVTYGWAEVVQVTYSCEVPGLIHIERCTLHGFDDKKQVKEALSCCGWTTKDLRGKGKISVLLMIADALMSYWGINGDNYRVSVITQEYYGDSWDKEKLSYVRDFSKKESVKLAKEYNHDLRKYVEREFDLLTETDILEQGDTIG